MKAIRQLMLTIWAIALFSLPSQAQNLLKDGAFNTTSSITPYYTGPEPLGVWSSWHNDPPTNMITEITGGICKYTILNAGQQSWEIQLAQWGIAFEQGYNYRLKFDVKADAPRTFGVFLGESGGSWRNFNQNNYWQNATTIWETKTIDISVPFSYSLYKFSVEMGGNPAAMYFDNFLLEKIAPPAIEIIGDAVPGSNWTTGTNMATTDNINYSLSSITLNKGEAKFRLNKDWTANWGAPNFPSGTGVQDGPNIPIPAGTYDISFNRLTGFYKFYCATCPPTISIIGNAIPPAFSWVVDVSMNTMDGIHYSLSGINLANGELKFRQDNSWNLNWGNQQFPAGLAILNGPNIPVLAGYYNIQFNQLSGEYLFKSVNRTISMVGTSLDGWSKDVVMTTSDGFGYTLTNQHFTGGEVKFRQDLDWTINWGNNTFPFGYGFQGGPNIPVPEGNYNVEFIPATGQYRFQLLCPDLHLECPADMTINNSPGLCGAVVNYAAPMPTSTCGNPQVVQYMGLPSGAVFPIGETINAFYAYNQVGQFTSCMFKVLVVDKEPPVITLLGNTFTNNQLWPPNHKMIEGKVYYEAKDNCSAVTTTLSITSNEPENGLGDGDASPDWAVMSQYLVALRAERSGKMPGRIYTITITATDAAGNVSTKDVLITVPHDKGDIQPGIVTKLVPAGVGTFSASISPNPSSRHFNMAIQTSSPAKVQVKIIDLNGRILQQQSINPEQMIRLGETLKPGIYLVELLQGTQKWSQKIIKQ